MTWWRCCCCCYWCCSSRLLQLLLQLLLLLHASGARKTSPDDCLSTHFYDVKGNEVDDYIIYGLTQDCQIFFIRPSQIPLLSTINVNVHNSYCYPNLVQLHLKSYNTLLLLTKQAGNRICTLDVQIPPTEMLFGDHLFSYSLISSLPYASCSHASPQMFRLEPDLSFLDTVFSDVLYFIDSQSTGALWSVHQFQINSDGYLRHLEKISVNNHAKPLEIWTGPDLAAEYIVALDNQRNFIYVRNRYEKNLLFECSYDMLFRPNTVVTHYLNTSSDDTRPWLNSMSADQSVLLYTETDRSVTPPVSRLYAMNTGKKSYGKCLVFTNYAFDVGVMRISTMKKMQVDPLPSFEFSRGVNNKSKTTSASSTSLRWTTSTRRTPRPSTSTRRTSAKNLPKLTTIYMTSTEKIVTSTEFRLRDDIDNSLTSTSIDYTTTSQGEKAKILERDHDRVSLLPTLDSEEVTESAEEVSSSPNLSSVSDLINKVPHSSVRHSSLITCSVVYCLFMYLLE